MKSKLIAISVPSKPDNHKKVASFYARLLGLPTARSYTDEYLSSHMPISNDGHFLFISDRMAEDEQIACIFAVNDLDTTIKDLEAAGGKAFTDHFVAPLTKNAALRQQYTEAVRKKMPDAEITDNMGRAVLFRDPEGSVICLMELEKHAEMFFNVGDHMVHLDAERANAHLSVMHHGSVHLEK